MCGGRFMYCMIINYKNKCFPDLIQLLRERILKRDTVNTPAGKHVYRWGVKGEDIQEMRRTRRWGEGEVEKSQYIIKYTLGSHTLI